MPTLVMQDGTELYYKDWGSGPAVVFSHGWPLTADAWDDQMMYLASRGFRCIAHDRRGHGRSTHTWAGHTIDRYADDLAALVAALDLDRVVHVGHSVGAAEVVRYVARHGHRRVSKLVLIAGMLPFGRDKGQRFRRPDTLEQLRRGVLDDRFQYFTDLGGSFFGTNRACDRVPQPLRDWVRTQGMMAGLNALHACIEDLEMADFTKDLALVEVPTLIIHGEEDQVVPVDAARVVAELVEDAKLDIYPGAPHGLCWTHKHVLNENLAAFIRRGRMQPDCTWPAIRA